MLDERRCNADVGGHGHRDLWMTVSVVMYWESRNGLRTGVSTTQWRSHFSRRVQGRILNTAAPVNARVIALEFAHIQVVPQACAHGFREEEDSHRAQRRLAAEALSVHASQSWEALDVVNLEDIVRSGAQCCKRVRSICEVGSCTLQE